MTAEVAVMNQRAVALAADSAITLVSGPSTIVRNSQKKLFQLDEKLPLGIMFFGLADLLGHPWETLIVNYRETLRPGELPSVRDHARHFLGMLDRLGATSSLAMQKREYSRLLASVFRYIIDLARYLRDTDEFGRSSLPDTAYLARAIDRVWHNYRFYDDGRPRRDLACFPQDFAERIAEQYRQTNSELVAQCFEPFGLPKRSYRKLAEIASHAVVKDLFLEDVTGLVFAGFGSNEHYPCVVTCFVSAMIGGIAKRADASIDAIDTATRSKLRIFGDSEISNAFIRGIDVSVERRSQSALRTLMQGFMEETVHSAEGMTPHQRQEILRRSRALLPGYLSRFRGTLSQHQRENFVDPVLRVLEVAGIDELATTAQELVSLNALRKRITAESPTVGGAIDVAVISRESGFQWHGKPQAT
ncbi:MAG: hypothetical protein JOZ55_05980 [Alphaproteobacteria bacterium]|nr:hypothetical protein [Alphaproteobacteria bacterium]